jgi:hypothetical protein
VNTICIPPPQQAHSFLVVEEEIPMELHHLSLRNSVILEDSSKEILATPTPSSEPHAFAAGASSLAPPVLVAPVLAGDDDDDNEKENSNNEDPNNEQEQEDNFVGMWPVTEHYTSMFEMGHFSNLLQDVLHALGTYVRPIFDTRQVSELPRACYYITRMHIRVLDAGDKGFRTLSSHESLTPLSTYAASVSNAARRVLGLCFVAEGLVGRNSFG